MTVPSTDPIEAVFAGDGTANALQITWRFLNGNDLIVTEIVNGIESETPLERGVHYTVTGGGSAGGTVIPAAERPIGTDWRVRRRTPRGQPASFPSDAYSAKQHEQAHDRLALIQQEQDAEIERAARAPRGQAGPALDPIAGNAGKMVIVLEDDPADPRFGYAENDPAAAESAAYRAEVAQAAVASDADQVAADRLAVAADLIETGLARDDALAAIAGGVADFYPGARSNVPQGATGHGTITGGSGGTDGTFALAFTSGNFDVNPTGTFTVSGGAVTAITIDGPGLYIGGAISAPTLDFSASAGLTGASAALTTGYLKTSGEYYYTDHATDTDQIARFQNQGNVAVEVDAAVDWLSIALARSYAEQAAADVGGGVLSHMINDLPDTQLMPNADVRLASNWTRAGGGAVSTGSVVDLDDQDFPVAGLFGYEFTLQDNAASQRVEIVSPQFTPIDLSDNGFSAGDTVTLALFIRNATVDPLDGAKYLAFGFNMGVNRVAIPMTDEVNVGNGWSCYYVQKVLTAGDIADTSTTGSINGAWVRTQAAATETFSGVLAAPIIFKGNSRGFLRYLQADVAGSINTARSQAIEDQLRGPVVAFQGDSRTIQGQVGSTYKYLNNRSYVHWLRMLMRQNFDTTKDLNFGVGGERTDQILARMPANITTMQAAGVEVCCLLGSTNDRGVLTSAQSIANLQAMVDLLKAAGIRVVIGNETPRTDLSGPLLTEHVAVRDAVEAMHDPLGGVAVAYTWQPLASSGDPDVADSVFFVDSVHAGVRGCYEIGKAFKTALSMFLPRPRSVLPRDAVQMIEPFGNLLANAEMAGSGTVADGFAYVNNAGGTGTATSSLYTDADGKVWQKAVLSGTPGNADPFVRWTQIIDLYKSEFQAGDVLDAAVEVKVESPVGIKSWDLYLPGPNNYDGADDIGGSGAAYRLGPDDYEGVLRTLPVTVTSEPANLQLRMEAVGENGVPWSGTVYFRLAAIRKLTR